MKIVAVLVLIIINSIILIAATNYGAVEEDKKADNTSNEIPNIKRLPTYIVPVQYYVKFNADGTQFIPWKKNNVMTGEVKIEFLVKKSTNVLYLHCSSAVTISLITDDNNSTLNYTRLNSDVIMINMNYQMEKGQKYSVNFNKFTTYYPSIKKSGWMFQMFKNFATKKNDYLLVTQMQPESGRDVMPCFDEPKFKSRFKVTLIADNNYNMISNMPTENCTKLINQKQTSCTFVNSIKMPIYNLVMAIVPFGYIKGYDKRGRMFRLWVRDSEKHKAEFALNITIKIFELYEKEFGIDFPLQKVDSLAVPNLNGFLGMEHYGLITYHEPVLIIDETKPLTFSRNLCTVIISHEVAHQWFGNLVTNYWWQDLWINEGFTTYYSYKIAQKLINYEIYEMRRLYLSSFVRSMDDYFHDFPESIRFPVYRSADRKFNYLAYNKGAIVVDMIQRILGEHKFNKAMIDYLTTYSYQSITTYHVMKILNKYSSNVEKYITNWLNKNGYPTISVRSVNDSIYFDQINVDNFTKFWPTKLRLYIRGNKTIFNNFLNLEQNDQKISFKNISLIIANYNVSSFVSVDYDSGLMVNIIKVFNSAHQMVPVLNRAQIIKDMYDLSLKYQRKNLITFLELLKYIRHETESVALNTALDLIDKLNGLFTFRNYYLSWHRYLQYILNPSFVRLMNEFNLNFTGGGGKKLYNAFVPVVRQKLFYLACKLDLWPCPQMTDILVQRLNKATLISTDYDLLHIALCRIITKDYSGKKWEELKNNTQFSTWDTILIKYYAMGCSRTPWVVDKIFGIIFDIGNIKWRNSDNVIFSHVLIEESDVVISDNLSGITGPQRVLMLSSVINNPYLLNVVFRSQQNMLDKLYQSIVYRSQFPISNALLEHIISTHSHMQMIWKIKNESSGILMKFATKNIKWIQINDNIDEYLSLNKYKTAT